MRTGRPLTFLILVFLAVTACGQAPELVVQLGHSGQITAVAFSQDGRFLISAGYDNTIRLWERDTGREVRRFRGHGGMIYQVAWLPDGRHIASASLDGTARLWDRTTGAEVKRVNGKDAAYHLAGDGAMLIGVDDGAVLMHSLLNDMETRDFKRLPLGDQVVFSPESKTLATNITAQLKKDAQPQEVLVIWDWVNDKPIWWDETNVGTIRSIAFSDDGKLLATGSDDSNSARIYDAVTGKLVKQIEHTASVLSVDLSPDGSRLLTTSVDQKWHLFDTATGQEKFAGATSSGGGNSTGFAPGGGQFVIVDWTDLVLYNSADGKAVRRFGRTANEVDSARFSPKGALLVTNNSFLHTQEKSFSDGSVSVWDLGSGAERARLPLIVGGNSLAFSNDGKLLVAAAAEGVILWDINDSKEIGKFINPPSKISTVAVCAAISPDKTRLVIGYGSISSEGDHYALLSDVRSGKVIRRFETSGSVSSVAFSPDGQTLLIGSGEQVLTAGGIADQPHLVQFIDLSGQNGVKTLSGNHGEFLPDGKHFVVADAHAKPGVVKMFDSITLAETLSFGGHTAAITDFSISPDGRILVTASRDNTIRLWDVTSAKEIDRILASPGMYISVSISSDGRLLSILGDDGVVHIRDIAAKKEICRLISLPNGTWVTVDETGRFDTNNLESINGLHWVIPEDPMRALPLEIYMRNYYEPGLLARKIKGEVFPPLPALGSVNRKQPLVSISTTEEKR